MIAWGRVVCQCPGCPGWDTEMNQNKLEVQLQIDSKYRSWDSSTVLAPRTIRRPLYVANPHNRLIVELWPSLGIKTRSGVCKRDIIWPSHTSLTKYYLGGNREDTSEVDKGWQFLHKAPSLVKQLYEAKPITDTGQIKTWKYLWKKIWQACRKIKIGRYIEELNSLRTSRIVTH